MYCFQNIYGSLSCICCIWSFKNIVITAYNLLENVFLMIFSLYSIDSVQSKCCGELSNVKIPVKMVASYSWTSSSCPRRAIVFKTIAGREFCVDPETTWVSGEIICNVGTFLSPTGLQFFFISKEEETWRCM
uniref:Chemokine interleukin-8-like domain-containing protein n=1 Tax=Cyprinus carpio TaxID=7962 RepID=A0A8C1UX06_CYPCA